MAVQEQQGGRDPKRRWVRNAAIWLALMVLLGLSLGAAYLPLGRATTLLGILIAIVKTVLVACLFMELARAAALIRLTALAGLVILAVFFALTFSDVLTRS